MHRSQLNDASSPGFSPPSRPHTWHTVTRPASIRNAISAPLPVKAASSSGVPRMKLAAKVGW